MPIVKFTLSAILQMKTGKYGTKEHCSRNFSAPPVGFIYTLPVHLVIFKFLLVLVIMFMVAVCRDRTCIKCHVLCCSGLSSPFQFCL